MSAPTALSSRVFINEVVTRDGFQIEPKWVATEDKIALINALSRCGVAKIEVSSFVSPRAVPNLRDAREVFDGIERHPGVVYTALVPNLRGATAAVAAKTDELNFVVSASESHNLANMRMSVAQSLAELKAILAFSTSARVSVNCSVATAFGCPFEGDQAPDRVLSIAEAALSWGARGVTFADTTGMANPFQVARLASRFRSRFADVPLTLHFHNTRGLGIANILAAYQNGARHFDAALGGLGGCPFAPGATGNVCTEDVVHMFDAMSIETNIDLARLIELSRNLAALLGHEVPGQVAKAGRWCDLHLRPTEVREAMARVTSGNPPLC
ncbi:hydroxymethylglutaryl-CoA lyase [Microbacteriaceae bacterium K1510]|nr:hydroxymethylglutaryl-CoA lyase [Microbacteriaceae bacterium K1510]